MRPAFFTPEDWRIGMGSSRSSAAFNEAGVLHAGRLIRHVPARLGGVAMRVSAALHMGAILMLLALWAFYFNDANWLWLPTAAMSVLFYLQHMRSSDIEFAAFRLNTLVGFVMLLFVWVGVA